jgi:predicted CXXCH cytochrome family protein
MTKDAISITGHAIFAAALAMVLATPSTAGAAETASCVTSSCHRAVGRAKVRHAALDEGCALCHEATGPLEPGGAHGKNAFTRLPDQTALCGQCHDNAAGMAAARGPHGPAAGGRCTACHEPHAAAEKALLRAAPSTLCAMCHDIGPTPARAHAPVADRECTACHAPHGGPGRPSLNKPQPELCLECHDGIPAVAPAAGSVHGPVEGGECTACHAAHGSEQGALLISDFPSGQPYRPYAPATYRLCFSCHDASMVDEGGAGTSFQAGGLNLHRVHVVDDRKGRTCRMCHDPHASTQAHLVRAGVPFGTWTLPIRFETRETGGSCLTACHGPKSYSGPAKPQPEAQPAEPTPAASPQ